MLVVGGVLNGQSTNPPKHPIMPPNPVDVEVVVAEVVGGGGGGC